MGWTRFFRRSAWDIERARELDAHLAIEIDANIARGMTRRDASDAAHRKLGNVTLIRHRGPDVDGDRSETVLRRSYDGMDRIELPDEKISDIPILGYTQRHGHLASPIVDQLSGLEVIEIVRVSGL